MIKHLSRFAGLVLLAAGLLASSAHAQQPASREEAVAIVKRAAAYLKANGRQSALDEFNNPKGQFIDRELYIVVLDFDGLSLANGKNQKMVGKRLLELRDQHGRSFAKDAIEVAKSTGQGWLAPFEFVNPVTHKMESKTVYVERAGDLVVLSGVYKTP